MSRILGTIQMRRGNAAEWTQVNPTLAPAEWGYELDTGLLKIGNGSAAWNDLPYHGGGSASGGGGFDVNLIVFGKDTVRSAGYGDNPFGVRLGRDATFTSLTVRCLTADASGSTEALLTLDGSAVATVTLPAAQQVAGVTVTGSWAFPAGSVLRVQVASVGATPGKGLVADVTGTA